MATCTCASWGAVDIECMCGAKPIVENYTFFWGNSSPFSQWHRSVFTIDNQRFTCAEQYMMYRKAELFDDGWAMKEIMATSDPREIKAWGRKVQGFEKIIWGKAAYDVVVRGSYAKYTQTASMADILLRTDDTIIVEAAPTDAIWGIGLDEATAIITPPEQWPGTNLLGKALMEVRSGLRNFLKT
jgi:ribA/ribD-fused uncharacterized protein